MVRVQYVRVVHIHILAEVPNIDVELVNFTANKMDPGDVELVHGNNNKLSLRSKRENEVVFAVRNSKSGNLDVFATNSGQVVERHVEFLYVVVLQI